MEGVCVWAAPMSPGGRSSAWRLCAPSSLLSTVGGMLLTDGSKRATDPDFILLAFSQVKCTGPLTEVIQPSLYFQKNLQLR